LISVLHRALPSSDVKRDDTCAIAVSAATVAELVGQVCGRREAVAAAALERRVIDSAMRSSFDA
jgi:hypothetical protein